MRKEDGSAAGGLRHGFAQLVRFGVVQARACAFAGALLAGIAASRLLPPLPVARYDLVLVALAFVLIGFFLWVAENAATYAGAWSYPQQLGGWQPVPLTKFGAWSLLISVTFVLVEHLGATGRNRRARRP
ncbi:DUF817 family protein [Streptomyces sp. NPDC005890]|uniref:DUF817 family protein n=1 Tax=Streptomyces sp. NPDC005890 TaxID=3154568 RepID=UPI0033F1852D